MSDGPPIPDPRHRTPDPHAGARVPGLRRWLVVYGALLLANLRAKMTYRADFLINLVAAAMVQALGYVFLYVVFQRIPAVDGWGFWEVACIYALVFITEGFGSLGAEGLWRLAFQVHRGEFDIVLIRPLPPILQAMASDIGLNGAGNVLLGAVMIAQALPHLTVEWTPATIAYALVLVASAVVIRVSMTLATASLAFVLKAPQATPMLLVHNVSNFVRFPIGIYGPALRAFLIAGLPFAFISHYPAAWIFAKEHDAWIGACTPLVALYTAAVATWLFNQGVRRYEGAGGV